MPHNSIENESSDSNETLIVSDLRKLQEEVERLKNGANDPWKKIATFLAISGGILGILSALISFPKTFEETEHALFPSANISYEPTSLTVAYDPGRAIFEMSIPIYVKNDGSALETVQISKGRVKYTPLLASPQPEGEGIEEYDAGPGDVAIYDKGTTSEALIPMGAGEGKLVTVAIDFDSGTFTRNGSNELDVDLITSRSNKQSLRYCFDLGDDQIKDLRSKIPATGKRFLTPGC